jgi:hypothetical protein
MFLIKNIPGDSPINYKYNTVRKLCLARKYLERFRMKILFTRKLKIVSVRQLG